MKILWMIPEYPNYQDYNRVLASVWIRCLQLLLPLKRLGHESIINKPSAKADIAIFFRIQDRNAQSIMEEMKKKGTKTIFNVVVNYYERVGNLNKVSISDQQISDCIRMTELADKVIVSSRFLLGPASRHNKNTVYIPDTVSREHFRCTKRREDFFKDVLDLRWAGHAVKASFLNDFYPAFKDLPVKFTVIAEKRPDLDFPFEFIKWDYRSFPQDITAGDICISPRIIDNSYDQGHSNFKIMVFLAQGVPALVSPQDSYLEVIRDHYNGFVCEGIDQWRERVIYLLSHRDILPEMSLNAIESSTPYLTENIIRDYEQVLYSLVPFAKTQAHRKGCVRRMIDRILG